MDEENIPRSIVAKYPQVIEIEAALRQYQQGQPITMRCRVCHELLRVSDLKQIGSLWVLCPNGCSRMHLKYAPHLSDGE
jgi:hypothetical protein